MGEIIEKDIIMEKINIAEILKDCPTGMELDCTLFDDVHFDGIDEVCDIIKCYIQDSTKKIGISFSKYGCYSSISKSKCVIFPKGKTTWEGFQRHFEDGDILTNKAGKPFILKAYLPEIDNVWSYCGIDCSDKFNESSNNWTFAKSVRFATEEEKQKLFDAIKANGYKWNEESKTLEKLVEPKFKVGDIIRHKASSRISKIIDIRDGLYITGNGIVIENNIPFIVADSDYELITKFDITTLIPFESRVLVRDDSDECWIPAIWAFKKVNKDDIYPFVVVGGNDFVCCIPYDGNQHLIGKKDSCDEFYKTWEE